MRRCSIILAGLLTGCVSSIEPQAGSSAVVLSSNPAQVAGCRLIRQETVVVRAYENFGENMHADTETRMRNAAVAVGGTNVLTSGPQRMGNVNAMQQTGDIYQC